MSLVFEEICKTIPFNVENKEMVNEIEDLIKESGVLDSDLCSLKYRKLFNKINKYKKTVLYPRVDFPEDKWKSGGTSEFYWKSLGYSSVEAKDKVVITQRIRCKRCVEYWVHHGFSLEEAKQEIMKLQSKISLKRDPDFIKSVCVNNFKSKKFFIESGYSEEESKKLSNPQFVEYWIERGFNLKESKQKIKEVRGKLSISTKKRHKSEEYSRVLFSKLPKNKVYKPSGEEAKFFEYLIETIDDYEIENVSFGVSFKNSIGEFSYRVSDGYIRIEDKKILLEYDGVYWHNEIIDIEKDINTMKNSKRTDILGIIRVSSTFFNKNKSKRFKEYFYEAIEKIKNSSENIVRLW